MARRQRRPKNFVAIDGEAIGGKYALLCASDGKSVYSESELTTLQCFTFLMKLKRRSPKGSVFVMFGLNYDVNMMIRDVPKDLLVQLWQAGECWVTLEGHSFRLFWIPRKKFEIYSPDVQTRIVIFDVFGFFQSSFTKALEQWQIEDANEQIKKMKLERARFNRRQREEIERYCLAECRTLVELCNRLEASLLQAGIALRSYMGAGSVAGALMNKEKVRRFHVHDEEWAPEIVEAIYCSYFGGRVEQFLQGIVSNVVGYDIRSAYPYECLKLPSLIGGRWRKAREGEFDNALWLVEWVNLEGDVMPFPLRLKDNEIYWPSNGKGWHHGIEVREARKVFPGVRCIRGYVFEPETDEKPFSFVRSYYQARLEAKRSGLASEKALKLGLNSLYGKLAQGVSRDGIPPFRSLFWAGRITAGTRARMMSVASLNSHGVVSIATDGIVFSGDPRIEESETLGGWERTEYDEIFIAQSGIYWAKRKDGTETKKTRGFFLKEIDFDDLREQWLEEGIFGVQRAVCENCSRVEHKCRCKKFSRRRRFIGLGSALMRTDFSIWRSWQESDRVIKLHSARKFYTHENQARIVRLQPPSFSSIIESVPYVPKSHTLPLTEEMREAVSGFEQPAPDA